MNQFSESDACANYHIGRYIASSVCLASNFLS